MKKIAVIGSGVAGLVSAYYLSKTHYVDLFEAESRIGGHTNTVLVDRHDGPPIPVDTGFIVFNHQNYPRFLEFINELGVGFQPSDMSFSVTARKGDFFWGSDFPSGIFAQRRHWVDPAFYRFLAEIHRFNKRCLSDLKSGLQSDITLGEYLESRNIHRRVVLDYVLPMTSAIWSVSFEDSLKFPMQSFIRFWNNHQLLEIGKGLQWQTISGGSKTYIDKALPRISGSIFTNSPVQKVVKRSEGIEIRTGGQCLVYDGVVVATHADTAFGMLDEPSPSEIRLLSPWRYSVNRTVLHSDISFLPPRRPAWCSWNVQVQDQSIFDSPASVTYWMNRLQSIVSEKNYLVTLNPAREIRESEVIREMSYTHPVMDSRAMATQAGLVGLNKRSRIVFCGSYFGYGFHEDAVNSAVGAVGELNQTLAEDR
ncbi:FAD-dependent oxidoreductase [bacterium]|nr:FAD-dependent oxidoreductase [bacterium]